LRKGIEIVLILMILMVIFDSLTLVRHPSFMLLFFSLFACMGFATLHVQFGTSIRINMLKNEAVIHTFGYKKKRIKLDELRFGMTRSERIKEMENTLLTNSGSYFIPEGVFFNRPKKLRLIKEILTKNK
jgi:hypothetical protein